MKAKLLFILNPISGHKTKEKIPVTIEKYIDKNIFTYKIAWTKYAGHATEIAREAAKDGIDVVVAVGGDGTVNEVGRGLVDTNTALAIIPTGSGNGLARHLAIPMNIKQSIEIINHLEIKSLDYGLINDIPFFCTCGMGFDAFISMKFAEAGKRGPLTYVQKVLEGGLSYTPQVYEITDDSGTHKYKAFLISIANASQYGNNAYIAPQASMSDGELDVIIIEPFGLLDVSRIVFELFNKTIDKNHKIKTFKAKSISIHREKEGVVHFDGDPITMGKAIKVKIVNKGIKVVVNPNNDTSYRQPNTIQTGFSALFSNIDLLRANINKQKRRVIAINKNILRKIK